MNFSEIRRQKRITQQEMADAIGVSCGSIKRLEKDSKGMSIYTIQKYLDICGKELVIKEKSRDISTVDGFVEEVLEKLTCHRAPSRPRSTHRYGWVYVMTYEDIVKIGVTQYDDPKTRAIEIYRNTGRECKVYYAKLVSNIWKTEGELHNHFDQYRLDGEWFSIDASSVKEILEQKH